MEDQEEDHLVDLIADHTDLIDIDLQETDQDHIVIIDIMDMIDTIEVEIVTEVDIQEATKDAIEIEVDTIAMMIREMIM